MLTAIVASTAIGCSNDETPPTGGTTTGGGPSADGGQPDSSRNLDAAVDIPSTADAPIDASQPPADRAVDMRAPIDAAADTSRPTDATGGDTGIDTNRVDAFVDSTTPPMNDSAPPPVDSGGGGGMDTTTPDVVGPGDAGCDSTLTGVDLFRCQALNYGQAYEHLEDLTTNVGPRLAGTAGYTKAVDWATKKLMALGLQNVHTEAVTVPHWERGDAHAELLGTTETKLAIAALGGSVATATGGLEAEVIEVASVSALSALSNSQVQGKIVFVNVVMQRTMDASGYSAATGARRSGPSTAASKGAAGYIVRSITPAMDNAPHTGDMNSIPNIPAVAIGVQDALVLSSAIKAGTTRVRITLGCQTLPNVQTSNVIGEFVGKQAPSEILLVGGHLDSWDLATGAHDDGAGVVMAAEAARLISVYAPDTRRTVRVVLFANEEFGLSGANAYASAHSSDNHVMAIEADLGGDRAYGVTFSASSAATTTIRNLLAALMPLGVAAATTGSSAGADLGPLSRAGVPVAELQQDLTRYFDFHHAPTDVMSNIDRAQLTQATAAMAVFAYQLARSDVNPAPAPIPLASEEHPH